MRQWYPTESFSNMMFPKTAYDRQHWDRIAETQNILFLDFVQPLICRKDTMFRVLDLFQ
jgi:hypothetical protein